MTFTRKRTSAEMGERAIGEEALSCPLCLSNRVVGIGKRTSSYTRFDYTLYACGTCDSRFFNHAEYPVALKEKYEEHAVANSMLYQGKFRRSAYWSNEVALIRSLAGGKIDSVLDIGCRTGDFLMHWPAELNRSGIELSAYSAGIARGRGLNVMEGFLEEMDIQAKYDVVTLYAILEHLREPRKFLACLPNLVTTDGMIAILIPSFQCAWEKLHQFTGKKWHMYSPPEHLNFLSRMYLDSAMAEMGFRLVRRKFTSGGMFNPFAKVPLVSKVFHRGLGLIEYHTPMNRLPFFDHMYSYYKRGH